MIFTPLTEDRLNHLAEIGTATDYMEALQDTQTFIYVGETATRTESAPLSEVFTIHADQTFLHGNVYNIAITGCDDNGDPIGAINWHEWARDNGRDDVQNPHDVDFFQMVHSDWVEVTDYSIKGYLALIERNGSGRRIKKNKQTTPEPQFTELETNAIVVALQSLIESLEDYQRDDEDPDGVEIIAERISACQSALNKIDSTGLFRMSPFGWGGE